jgi:hypothetical protein
VIIDPDQLPMFPAAAVSSEPTGWWADAGRFMVGEAEEMPETAQEANTAADAPDTAPGSACAPTPPTEPATPAEWVDRVEACGCRRRVQMAGPRGTWALGYRVERCEGHSGGRR